MHVALAELNVLDKARFVALLGGVFEHSPWVAERAWKRRPFATVEKLFLAMREEVAKANVAKSDFDTATPRPYILPSRISAR